MPRSDWSDEYIESAAGWYKEGEVDQRGHQVYYGWDTDRKCWYQKTHRGGRGKRKSEQTEELLALREQVKAKDAQLARIQEEDNRKELEREEKEARLRSSKEAAEHLAEKEKRRAEELQQQLETESSELLDTKQEYWNLEQKYQELLSSQPEPHNPYLDRPETAASSSGRTPSVTRNKQGQKASAAATEREPADAPVKTEEIVKTEDGEFYVVSLDYNKVLNRESSWREGINYRRIYQPISESISQAVEDLLDAGLQIVICSFAVDRAESVLQELTSWRLWDRVSDTFITNQRYGAPYPRDGIQTSGGKDFFLGTRGIRHHVEDNSNICKAAEAQGITCYRVNPEQGDWETHRGHPSYDTTQAALQKVLQNFKRNPNAFLCDGQDFFDKGKVPWIKSSKHVCWICDQEGHKSFECPQKGKGKGKGKGKSKDRHRR